MSVALQSPDLPPEAIALIKAGTPSSSRFSCALESPAEKPAVAPINVPGQNRETEPQSGQDPNASCVRPEGVALATEAPATPRFWGRPSDGSQTTPVATAASAAITVRVPAGLPIRLLRAATERKISQQPPFRQQEIVAHALEQWLDNHGY
jgi:hypothetical protein